MDPKGNDGTQDTDGDTKGASQPSSDKRTIANASGRNAGGAQIAPDKITSLSETVTTDGISYFLVSYISVSVTLQPCC